MYQLITIIIAIALLSMVLGTGINWVSMQALPRREAAIMANAGYEALVAAVSAYRVANGSIPTPQPDGSLPPRLVPDYTPEPRAPEGMAWAYGVAPNGDLWVCMYGHGVKEPIWDGLENQADRFPVGSVGLLGEPAADSSYGCGMPDGSGQFYSSAKPVTFPARIFFSVKLNR